MRNTLIFSLAAATAILATSPPAQWPTTISPGAFVDWADEQQLPLDGLDWDTVDLTVLKALDRVLEGKRIVYLGEPDHLILEKMDYRLIMIRYLHSRGWRHVGMEMGRSDGRRIDRFLATGDEAWLQRVAILGYDGDQRDDRDDSVPGWTEDRHPELWDPIREDTRWFLRGLRTFNEGLPPGEPPVRYFGYDVSVKPGGGYVDAWAVLSRHAEEPIAVEILERLRRVEGESRIEEAERLETLVGSLAERDDAVLDAFGARDRRELRRALICMAEGLRFVEAIRGEFTTEEKHTALRRRELNMHSQMDEILAALGPDEKIILLGHNLHLSRASSRVDWEGRTMWPTIGTHLASTIPDQVYAVWMLYEQGQHVVVRGEPPLQRILSLQFDLETLLARVGDLYLLPLGSGAPAEGFLAHPRNFSMGGFRPRCALTEQADAIFFVRRVSAPRKR